MKLNLTIVGIAVLAVALGGFTGCNTTPTQDGAVAGGLIGAGAGAIIGNQNHGRSGEGALIGAGVGALTGALIGDQVDEHRDRKAQQQQAQPVEQASPPPQPAPAPAQAPAQTAQAQTGHWETRTVTTESGETYEERVWVPES